MRGDAATDTGESFWLMRTGVCWIVRLFSVMAVPWLVAGKVASLGAGLSMGWHTWYPGLSRVYPFLCTFGIVAFFVVLRVQSMNDIY